ncbi:MAG: cytochrome c [Tepidisphaeraceae bacterium]|jgi:mono/diheme cytochrome c family protein
MSALTNTILGMAFLVLAIAATFLMYHLWGYPFDHEKLKSSAPPRLMLLHRILGYGYVSIYVILMTQMVPRLWRYQVEFPARTVLHIAFGMLIGVLLIIKIAIVRYFKHLEGALVPFLGTSLLICTVLVLGLSVPFSLRLLYVERHAPGGSAFGEENLQRVSMLLSHAQLPGDVPLAELVTPEGLHMGQSVLMTGCLQCHDLRTVLAKPRTPDEWIDVVRRMSQRSSALQPITAREQQYVIAYLVAISPELRLGVADERGQEQSHAMAQEIAKNIATEPAPVGEINLADSRRVFEISCVQCHALTLVEQHPPRSQKQAEELVNRMVDNGLDLPDADLQKIIFYLKTTYAK